LEKIGIVNSLYTYPIKSCRGYDTESLNIDDAGIIGDRDWLVVDAKGKFVTQRQFPKMATLAPPFLLEIGTRSVEITIWNDKVSAIEGTEPAQQWIRNELGPEFRLTRISHQKARFKTKLGTDYYTRFADSAPFLITNTKSLEDLVSNMKQALPMDRFRPNIVVSFDKPWLETGLNSLKIGEVFFPLIYACTRCVIPSIDQITGKKGNKEILTTLNKHPQGKDHSGAIAFGVRGVHSEPGIIRKGDEVWST